MRWHTTFPHNVTIVLCENVVSVPAENSFEPNHNMTMQNKNLKAMHPTHTDTTSMHMACHYPHHRPNDGITSQDGISQHAVQFPGTPDMRA